MPNKPTSIEVTTFKPTWNPHIEPIKFIMKIINPPITEFTTNLIIAFNGTENTFPIIHKAIIHPKIIKPFEKSNFYHHTFNKYL